MAGHRSSYSRPRSPKPGNWERCSVPHSRLVELQTQGFLPLAYMVPVRAGLATYNGEEQAENSQVPLRGAGMPCPLLTKGTRISNSSVPPRAPGVLRPPITQSHPFLHPTHHRLCFSLRVVPGLRGSLRAVEKAIFPCPSHIEGLTLSSERS